jgi:hypothetical protein
LRIDKSIALAHQTEQRHQRIVECFDAGEGRDARVDVIEPEEPTY